MKKLLLMGVFLSLATASYGNNPKPTKLYGYNLYGCTTGERDYCKRFQGDVKQVIDVAEKQKSPNFAKDKVLVRSYYKGENHPISDFFVVDTKTKDIYLAPQYAWFDWEATDSKGRYPTYAPKAVVNRNFNKFCLYQKGAWFSHYGETVDEITASPMVEEGMDGNLHYVCMSFGERNQNEFGGFEIMNKEDYTKIFK